MKTVEKYHIHTLTVDAAGEKKLFQIKLPRNAKKITGILVTVKPFGTKPRPKEPVPPPIPEIATPVKAAIPVIAVKTPLIPIEHAI